MRFVALFVLALVIAGSTYIRIHVTFSNPAFNPQQPQGQLMSDPALLFYLTERIVDNGGLPPGDFHADRRVQHPDPIDLPAVFTVGQEFYLAWGYRLFGSRLPLHAYCVIAMSLFAALAAIGVFGLTYELTGRTGWAVLACLLYVFIPANYRTVGFILMREDFSLPLFAIHLWLAARAGRVGNRSAFALAAITLAAAVSTWHAMVFIATLEMAAVFSWYLRTGHNPLARAHAWLFPGLLAGCSLLVPVLRARWFPVSLPMLLLYGLFILSIIERRRALSPPWRIPAGLTVCAAAAIISLKYAGDYGHVFDLILSKLICLGRLPQDPNTISFDARLLWQGPFATGSPVYLAQQLGIAGLLLVAALFCGGWNWWRGQGDNRVQILLTLAALFLISSLFIKRLVVLDGIVAPVAAVLLLVTIPRFRIWTAATVILFLQAALMAIAMPAMTKSTWYMPVESRNLSDFLDWTQTHLNDDSAIAADFVNSAAILAHTNHPVILQPKYETRASRRRIERFVSTFYHGSPADMHALLKELDCSYLLIDIYVMSASRYQAGLAWQERPASETAAAAFLSSRSDIFGSIPGFSLVYTNDENPPTWRLYQLKDICKN